jgi:predicted MPP superfamily phosphohydrolase
MHTPRYTAVFVIFIVLAACNFNKKKSEAVWSGLPEVTSLESLKQTKFVITLENQIPDNKNIIYAPSFLFAWDKVKEELKNPVIYDSSNSIDFRLLNKSTSHQNSLSNTEYSVEAEIIDGAIIARAFFNKILPFETKLQVLDEPINFNATKVAAFGMDHFDEVVKRVAKISYYKDDNNFVLKLTPKDKQHEIILVKGIDKYETLTDAIELTNDLIAQGKTEQLNKKLSWKYEIVRKDIYAIPTIKFNISTNYKNLEGQVFTTNNKVKHTIEVAYQRTGFSFNENGAVVESEASAATDSVSAEPVVAHPKKMVFDQPFLLIIKRVDKTNPYFVMKVTNTELMTIK